MGFSASAELVWGIPVAAYDDDGNATQFWDEEEEYWRSFGDGSVLDIHHFGYYADMDGITGILTTKRIKMIMCHDYGPKAVVPVELEVSDGVVSKAEDDARDAGLDVSFYASAAWYLVVSYG